MIYIFDIDGTLADLSHRLHFIKQKPADWDSFFAACPKDHPIQELIMTARLLAEAGADIVMVSGRSDAVQKQTAEWFREHGIPCHSLYMREAGDHREDSVVKAELLADVIENNPENSIVAVFEDRKQVVDMYRAKGLKVFQVAEGNF
jgi:phosphoglycolate phosphatase-like HAD superfamily hydrolase